MMFIFIILFQKDSYVYTMLQLIDNNNISNNRACKISVVDGVKFVFENYELYFYFRQFSRYFDFTVDSLI